MDTEESKKVDKEVSLTRRAAIKAGWAVPVILAIGLGGNTFVHATGNAYAYGENGGGHAYGKSKPGYDGNSNDD